MPINWKKDVFTVPNILSLCRLVLIPICLNLYLGASTPEEYLLSAVILGISCVTDALDGMIARRFHMTSNLGKFLDPLADKATQLILTGCLAVRYSVLVPLFALLVTKELIQLIAVTLGLRQGKALPGALPAGKISTTVLFVSLIFLVLVPNAPDRVIRTMALLNGCFLNISLATYIHAYWGRNKRAQDFRP